MKRFLTLTAAAVLPLLTLAACSTSQPTAQAPTQAGVPVTEYPYQALDFPDLSVIDAPEPTRVELPNGMVVFLLEDHELPLVSLSARVGAGAVWEPADKVGLASITGEVMRTGGTQTMPADDLNLALENIGATVETYLGDQSGGAFMSTLSEHVDTVLPLFADVLLHPAFPEDKIALSKTQTKTAISRRNDDAGSIAGREFNKLIYGADSPYARTEEYYTIDAIQRDDLVAFHRQYFHPNNTRIAVYGDFDTEAMVAKLRAAFADWQPATGFTPPEPPAVDAERYYAVNYVPKKDVTQSTVYLGHVGEITRDHPDYAAVVVMNQVLSGGFSGRLMQEIRANLGLAYGAGGSYSAGYRQPGAFFAQVATKNETATEATEAMLREIEKLRAEAPTTEEVQLAKDAYLNRFVFNFDTKREVVDRLMTYDTYGYPADHLQQLKAQIEAVTPADVQRVAATYLHPDEVVIIVVGNGDEFGRPLSDLGPVNERDITIPTTPPGGAVSEVDTSPEARERGRALLNDAVASMGGNAFTDVRTFRQTAEQVADTPMGEMTISLTTVIDLPGDRFRQVQALPMGEVAIVMNGDAAKIVTPMGTQEAPPSVVEQVKGALWNTLPYLFAHADQLTALDAGKVSMDGQEVHKLLVTPPGASAAITLWLDVATHRPVRLAYQGMGQAGPVQTEERYTDYATYGSLTLPSAWLTFQNGEQAASTTVTATEVNPELEDALFEVE